MDLEVKYKVTVLPQHVYSQMEKSAQAMTAAPAGSPWAVANAYPAAVDSRNTNARKTNSLVQNPAR